MILGAALLLAALAWPLFTHQVYVEDDLAAFHLPFRAFYQQCLVKGDSFLWDPHVFNGYYLHGEGQMGMLHPWHWLLYRFLPLDTAFMLDLVSSYPLALFGMCFFLRRHSLTREAALFGGILCAFIGFNMNHYMHMHFVAVLAHLPWSLYALDRAVNSPAPRRWWAAVIGLGVSQLLMGFPQGVYYAWLMEAVYVLFLALALKAVWMPPLFALAKALTAGIAAAQLLPTWDIMTHSFRAAPSMDMQLSVSLHPLNFLSLLNPYLFQWRYFGPIKGDEPWDAPYLGAAATTLLLLALIRFRTLRTGRRLAVFALVLMLIGAFSALGRYGFLHPLYAWLPLVNKFRAPGRHLCIAHTGFAILAAVAFSYLQQQNASESKRRGSYWPLWAIPLSSLFLTFIVLVLRTHTGSPWNETLRHFTMSAGPLLLGMILVCAAALLILLAASSLPRCASERLCLNRRALIALALLTVADIALYSLRHKPHETMDAFINEIAYPPAPPGTRIDSDIHPMFMNRYGMKGYRGVYGYASFMPERRLDFTQETPLRLAGVEWRQTRHIASPELAAAKERGEAWVPLQGAFPRVRLLTQTHQSANPAKDIATLNPAQTALVDQPLDLPPGTPGHVSIIKDRPGILVIHSQTGTRQLLTVAESWNPGWHASVDGQRTELLRVNGDFFGTLVEPGDHEVRFVFAPDSFKTGLWISLASVVITMMGLWFFSPKGPHSESRLQGASN